MYSGLQDAMNRDAEGSTGVKVILPSSFTGGDCYMHQQYLDSMALFQRFGRPHFFITMTLCFQDDLISGSTPSRESDGQGEELKQGQGGQSEGI